MPKLKDLTNQKFGLWTVLYKDNSIIKDCAYWVCQCECGTIRSVKSASLLSGKSKSCGCQVKNYLVNQKFGKLTVLYLDKTKPRGPGQHLYWVCQCDCGNIISVESAHLKNHTKTSCGCDKQNVSKGVCKIKTILQNNNIIFEQEKTFPDCINIKKLPFNFYLPDYNTIIEFDGRQHFSPTSYFGGKEKFKQQQINDSIKNNWCKTNNIILIRIPYTHEDNIVLEDLLPQTSKFIL